jgi:hypothetical protein
VLDAPCDSWKGIGQRSVEIEQDIHAVPLSARRGPLPEALALRPTPRTSLL